MKEFKMKDVCFNDDVNTKTCIPCFNSELKQIGWFWFAFDGIHKITI